MLRLIIGGQAQGKLGYALASSGLNMEDVFDCEKRQDMENAFDYKIIYNFHILTQKMEENPEAYVDEKLQSENDLIIISNEIGLGIVPVDRREREYREKTGRLLCGVAGKAQTVERVFCGIPQRIKG